MKKSVLVMMLCISIMFNIILVAHKDEEDVLVNSKKDYYMQLGVSIRVNFILDVLEKTILDVGPQKQKDSKYISEELDALHLQLMNCQHVNSGYNRDTNDYDIFPLYMYMGKLKDYYSIDRDGIRQADLDMMERIVNRKLYNVMSDKEEELKYIKGAYEKLRVLCEEANEEFVED